MGSGYRGTCAAKCDPPCTRRVYGPGGVCEVHRRRRAKGIPDSVPVQGWCKAMAPGAAIHKARECFAAMMSDVYWRRFPDRAWSRALLTYGITEHHPVPPVSSVVESRSETIERCAFTRPSDGY